MNKVIYFKNGSKIEILPAKELKRSKRGKEQRKSLYELTKYTMGDSWNNLHWYQKLYYRIYCEWIRRIYR